MEELKFLQNKSERLDKFLKENFPEFSRSKWQKAIKDNLVLVNEEKVTPHYKLKNNDKITIYDFPPENHIDLPLMDISILFENDNFIIIEKPAGLPVHPDSKYKTNTLIQQIIAKYPEIKEIDEHSERPGVVHRLDKDVSGLMVIARNKKTFSYLQEQFASRKVYKEYLALAHDPFTKLEDDIRLTISRDKRTGKMKVAPSNQEGKIALTRYEVINNFTHFAFLRIIIKTGRTHQIRTLFRALDHPIVGDPLYTKKKVKANIKINRPFLHSHKLKFHAQDGQELEFVSELPGELKEIINNLK